MDRCPEMISKQDWDYCKLTEKVSGRIHPCLLMSGDECETWEEIRKEWKEEEDGTTKD